MGNIQTIETRPRKPIFQHSKSPINRSFTPPPTFSTKNRIYIHPKDYKNVLKNNRNQPKHYSPFQGSRYKYSQQQLTPDIKKNTIYRNLQKKLSRREVKFNPNIMCRSYCGKPDSFHIYNESLDDGYMRHRNYIQNRVNYCGDGKMGKSSVFDTRYRNDMRILEREYEPNSLSFCLEGPYSPINKNNNYFQAHQQKVIEDSAPTQRKMPGWYNQQLPSSSQEIYEENRAKCSEIIKKVRNFNDFLNQIKKKVRMQQQKEKMKETTTRNCSKHNSKQESKMSQKLKSFNQGLSSQNQSLNYKEKQSKEISLMFKLQNQKMQLQKYRKMIERELSKQHSISSISIEDHQGSNKEKIIKIQYGTPATAKKESAQYLSVNEDENDEVSVESNLEKTKILSFEYSKQNIENQGHFLRDSKLVKKYQEVSKKLQELGNMIKDKGDEKSGEALRQRVQNINSLMRHLQKVNRKDDAQQIRQYFQKISPDFMKNQAPRTPSKTYINLKTYYESDDDI